MKVCNYSTVFYYSKYSKGMKLITTQNLYFLHKLWRIIYFINEINGYTLFILIFMNFTFKLYIQVKILHRGYI
jgi:hypothetical protein